MEVLRRVLPRSRWAAGRVRGRGAVVAGGVTVLAVVVLAIGTLWHQLPRKEALTVSGAFGQEPKVTFADGARPGGALSARVVIKGNGPRVSQRDLVVADFVSYTWNGTAHRLLDSGYSRGRPGVLPMGELIAGLSRGLTGQAVGSRLVLVIPPKDGYGPQGSRQARVKGTDTLVYVADLLATYPPTATVRGSQRKVDTPGLPTVSATSAGTAPTVRIPGSDPPDTLDVQTLIDGAGPAAGKKQLLVTRYQVLIWRTGKVIDSSWRRDEAAPLAMDGVIPGLAKGLEGKKAGSRVLLVIPPGDGYGTQGLDKRGIRPTDTLVFLVDILDVH